jgi:DNA-binding FrmR family transcriptional regulator
MGGVLESERTMDKQDTLRRLKNVEGHIRGIQKMVENDAYCIDLIRQIQAVQAALGKVSTRVLDDHLHSCLITAVRGEDPDERERVLKEISEVYEMAAKV